MKKSNLLILGFLMMLLVGNAQAGYLTSGVEDQMRSLSDADPIKVLVVMKDQPDIRALDLQLYHSKSSLDNRHQLVVETLQSAAKNSQGDLLAALEADKAGGDILGYTSHWIVNGVVVTGSVAKIRELAARSDVERVEVDLVVELIEPLPSEKGMPANKDGRGIGLTPGVEAIGAVRVWQELGINGAGVIVGVLDTGVDGNHPALADRWQGNFAPASETWIDAAGLGDTSFPVDQHYHGTHVMGTITGLAADDTIGVAPGATWIASNVINMSSGTAFDNAVIASLEFMADPDGDPGTTDDLPDVVQNSWGVNENFTGYYDCDSRWWDAIDNCEAAGVVLTWSAGNEGPSSGSLRSPGDRALSPTNCFSIGSTLNYAPYEISDFSSRGPSGCGGAFAVKPEVCAPGSDIYSAEPGGGYQYLNGTSMAGPHVAGVVALMRSANPDVDVITIKEILMGTAIDLGAAGEDNVYGHGFVDAYQAVLQVMGDIGDIEGTITDSATGQPIAGAVVRKVGGYNTATTDANGFYSMTMPAGAVDFDVTMFGYYDGVLSTNIPADGVANGDFALAPMPTGTVSGLVYGPEGQLVDGATVMILNAPVPSVDTDANGYYEVALPSGVGANYTLRARADGMGYQVVDVEVLGDLTLDFNLPELIAEDFESGGFLSYPWEMTGTLPWVIDDVDPFEGLYCGRSGNITHNEESELTVELTVGAAGDVAFWYKVSSEDGYDYLRFYVDGAMIAEWDGIQPWNLYTHPLTTGTHTLMWAYEKDVSVDEGDDAAWVDFIEFPTIVPPTYPAITVTPTTVAVTVQPDGTGTAQVDIGNVGENVLEYQLSLVELGLPGQAAMTSTVEYREFAKDEVDNRPAVSPLTGTGGPDAFGYSWTDSDEPGGPVYNWVEISGDGVDIGGSDDSNEGPFDLGFTFSYYGNTFDQVNICTNGWLSFTSTNTNYSNQGIPYSDEPNNLVAPFWDDMDPAQGGNIYYKADGDRFIVQWDAVDHHNNDAPETFQAILNTDGSIVFQYETIVDPDGCTVGIENGTGDDGLEVAFNANYLHDGLAIRLATAPPLTWVIADPLSGTVDVGNTQPIELSFDAIGMALGVYNAELYVASNDPAMSLVTVPVTMTVSSGATAVENNLPKTVRFVGAVPNPFNPLTNLHFSLPRDASVSLKLYDVSGRLVRSLVSESLSAGEHQVRWNGQDGSGRSVASGTYFARLVVDGQSSVKPLVLVR